MAALLLVQWARGPPPSPPCPLLAYPALCPHRARLKQYFLHSPYPLANSFNVEERLSHLKAEILLKEAALEEVRAQRAQLPGGLSEGGQQLSEAAAAAAAAAKDINAQGARLREVGRLLMGAVAELSLLQAMEMKLAGEAEAAGAALRRGEERAAAGLAPSAAAELKLRSANAAAALGSGGGGGGGGGASEGAPRPPQRPNAYAQEGSDGRAASGLGLQKPFPGPFQPVAGSMLR